ncbi:DegV family protein [Ornithinimicrobium flavum]|uniref:DegV family protein n=1 Tax=Ornithinimicrobium flavum TaxID=1288636 RepID=UPI00106F9E73|nr:DegV family protein [Ornithinimicrobium flavum]
MAVAVVTDSTSCLTPDRAEREGLTVVPLHVLVAGEDRVAVREISPGEVADILRRGKERVSTSMVTPGEFVEAFREVAGRTGCEEIVSVHLSGRISGTVESARSAASELTGELRVDVVDSGVLGMALGYAACTGARAAADGGGMEEVVRAVEARAAGTRTWFYVDTLEHLRRGGRIGRAQALLGSALAIKPLLTVRDGEVAAQEKVRTRAKALSRLVEHAAEAVADAGGPGSGVEVAVHELAAREAAEELASTLAGRTGVEPEIVELDPVVGSHTGPGTLAVVVAPR